MTLLEDMNFANTVVEIMINKYDEIFKNITYTEKSRTTVTVVEPTSHHQRSDSVCICAYSLITLLQLNGFVYIFRAPLVRNLTKSLI